MELNHENILKIIQFDDEKRKLISEYERKQNLLDLAEKRIPEL